MNTEPCGPPRAHFSEWPSEELEESIEIVESIDFEGPIEIVPAPLAVQSAPEELTAARAVEAALESAVARFAEPAPDALLSFELEAATEPELAVDAASDDPGDDDDPYALFLRTLAEVAIASGATMDAPTIDALLASDAVATAWRAILRGESEDFSKCAGTLDEWAANALASILSAPQKAGQLRRELRARGVAAFGLIDAA
jgi:hypothetical protein